MFDSPLETCYIGGTQSQFARTFNEMQFACKLTRHQIFHDCGSAVGRTIINDQYVVFNGQFHHGCDDGFDVLLLVVGWNNDKITHSILFI